MQRRRQLSKRILASVVGVLVVSSIVGFVLTTLNEQGQLEREYQQRAIAIAQTFAATPSIRQALSRRADADRRVIQRLAEQAREKTGATYIVVLEVTARMIATDASVIIQVIDTGPGVPVQLEDTIFTDGFTTKPCEGHRNRGLGLALVHRLVRRAGGTIAVEQAGASTFTAVLPLRKQWGVGVGA